jgi:hypothetical protein
MAVIGFINRSEALFNQTVLEAQASQAATQSDASTNIFSTAIGDEFTPSAQNTKQAAGIHPATLAFLANQRKARQFPRRPQPQRLHPHEPGRQMSEIRLAL